MSGDGREQSFSNSLDDQSQSPSPPQSYDHPPPIPSSNTPLTNSNQFYDPFDRGNVQASTTFVHPSTVPRPSALIRSATGKSRADSSSEIFGRHRRQNGSSNQYDRASQRQNRPPPIREPAGPTQPPTPPVLSIPSPTPSGRSSKVETNTPLPPRNVLLKLVEIYFTHVNNQTYGFLHRPTFLRHIEEDRKSVV